MIQTPDITRPPAHLVEALKAMGTASIAGCISRLGLRNPHLLGPVTQRPGHVMAGPALTLQFMPKREDLFGDGEYTDPEKQLHRHVLYHTQPGDVVVVDARGDMHSGVFGEMMLTYFMGRGGAGVILDGVLRDKPNVKDLDIGVWCRGFSPNYHVQTDIMPFAVNAPLACGNVLVMPGDIMVADDDGCVVVPVAMAEKTLEFARHHHEWEDFSRERLSQGGDLRVYYPLSDGARPEYEAWKKARASST